MAVNKVEFGSTVLVDLTEDTVTADRIVRGYTAHNKAGLIVTGSLNVVEPPFEWDEVESREFIWNNLTSKDITWSDFLTRGAIASVDIGDSTNLYTGTRDFSGYWDNIENWEEMDYDPNLGFKEYGRWGQWLGLYQTLTGEAGETYTISFYAKGDENVCMAVYSDWDNTLSSPAYIVLGTPTSDYIRYSATFTLKQSGSFCPRVENMNDDSWFQIYGIKVEKRSSATNWSPSPSDE